jgi:hypothetical protein
VWSLGTVVKQSEEYRAHQLLCQIVLVLEFLVGCLTKEPTAMPNTAAAVPSRPGYKLIFRAFITLKNGKKLYASSVGLKAWPIWVPE